jgi:hypothetical protein
LAFMAGSATFAFVAFAIFSVLEASSSRQEDE